MSISGRDPVLACLSALRSSHLSLGLRASCSTYDAVEDHDDIEWASHENLDVTQSTAPSSSSSSSSSDSLISLEGESTVDGEASDDPHFTLIHQLESVVSQLAATNSALRRELQAARHEVAQQGAELDVYRQRQRLYERHISELKLRGVRTASTSGENQPKVQDKLGEPTPTETTVRMSKGSELKILFTLGSGPTAGPSSSSKSSPGQRASVVLSADISAFAEDASRSPSRSSKRTSKRFSRTAAAARKYAISPFAKTPAIPDNWAQGPPAPSPVSSRLQDKQLAVPGKPKMSQIHNSSSGRQSSKSRAVLKKTTRRGSEAPPPYSPSSSKPPSPTSKFAFPSSDPFSASGDSVIDLPLSPTSALSSSSYSADARPSPSLSSASRLPKLAPSPLGLHSPAIYHGHLLPPKPPASTVLSTTISATAKAAAEAAAPTTLFGRMRKFSTSKRRS
ncbi:hypothetical protein PUNSTDRAFT_45133 [Punctularia strigosozonata HHB-11173 SS5]|uniref:uncharacterized protein n=1 Tax=Punctularia strigosozonata (strain HHB-11173) TaxID=741275 RepID=UPI0004416C05|nr:uncharacterized protein PUNSTDRAFT_45133 [Punctularia strigosozonata HHB-11173 SS5]EIN07570.1 hypothetical protein PUNSTDRAFT_45133 [Punctularia strigosozonata HHB-11173 SS5]